MQEIALINDIETNVIQGSISFPMYEELKNQALQVAEYVSSIEVTEDTVKQSKKLLATVNKSVKSLEDRRIAIKKELLIPYNEFEAQVKEIVGIVKEADTLVRTQVKELEEKEREEKQDKIEEIWNKRVQAYDFDFINIDKFLVPSHLNKTTSLSKVEDEMVTWLEKVNSDLKVIESLPDRKEILQEYIENIDLTVSMLLVNERKEKEKKVNEIYEENEDISQVYYFKIFNEKDTKLVELLLNENKIQFEKGIK